MVGAAGLDWLAGPTRQAALTLVGALLLMAMVHALFGRLLPALAKKTETTADDLALPLVERPLQVTLFLGGIWRAMVVGRPDTVLPGWVGSCLVTIMVIYWTTGLFRVSGLLLVSASQDESRIVKSRTLPLFQMGAKGLIVGLSIYAFFLAWNLDLTAWLASAGIVGIAVGFGARDTLANLFAGIAIMADAPYRLGDFVSLSTGERGRVTEIGLRSTRILTLDDVQIVVPNGNMASSLVVNESGGPRLETRVGVSVGVAYGSDVDRVREILLEEASEASYLSTWPKAVVLFEEMGDSALIFKVLAWLDHPRNRQLAIDALNTRIYKRLQAEGIEIPYPKQDVYLHRATGET